MNQPQTAPRAVLGRARDTDVAGAVIGNGRLLVTVSPRGEVTQISWPHIDHDPQIEQFRLAVVCGSDVRFLDDEPATAWTQSFDLETGALITTVGVDGRRIGIRDVVDPDHDVLLRTIRTGGLPLIVAVRPRMRGSDRSGAAYVDGSTGAIVSHHRDQVMALAVDAPARAAVGEPRHGTSVLASLNPHVLVGDVYAHGAHDAAILTREADTVVLSVAFASDHPAAIQLGERALRQAETHEASRQAVQRRLIRMCRPPDTSCAQRRAEDLRQAYERSLITLDVLTDATTGAVIAGPETDPDFTSSGGYDFVWPRDLGFVTLAMLAAGRDDAARAAVRWSARAQGLDGLWAQRHWSDATVGPCWGTQLDETGMTLFVYGEAWRHLKDRLLDDDLWPSTVAAAEALCAAIDDVTGLPVASVDLWEERTGIHAFTAGAAAAGLRAAAGAATRQRDLAAAARWDDVADRIVDGIDTHLVDEHSGRFVRSRWTGRADPDGTPAPSVFRAPHGHPLGRFQSVQDVDDVVDVSLLGLAYPFRIVAPDDPRMVATSALVQERLTTSDGGMRRFEDDRYMGGNPWPIARLWHGLYARTAGDDEALDAAVAWALDRCTPTGQLAEQVDLHTGRPTWVAPLAWSHAMLILAARPSF
jgi:GH15 family glucan-1,4-alpha-glucosidase